MRARHFGAVLAASVLFACSGRVWADPISLANGNGNQSAVEAGAADDYDYGYNTENVNSLPYTTPINYTVGSSTSTTTPTLSTSALLATFSGSMSDDGSETDGNIDIYFTANTNTSYSISGTETVVGCPAEGELYSSLYDVTTQTYVYGDEEDFNDGVSQFVQPATIETDTNVLTLGSMGDEEGSATGTLNAGDTYEFYLAEEMDTEIDTDPTLTGNGGITFGAQTPPPVGSSVPLPRSAPAALLVLPVILLWSRSRRASAGV